MRLIFSGDLAIEVDESWLVVLQVLRCLVSPGLLWLVYVHAVNSFTEKVALAGANYYAPYRRFLNASFGMCQGKSLT